MQTLATEMSLVPALPNPSTELAARLDAGQREQVLVEWNRTRSDYPDLCIHQLFEGQADRTPQAEAVVHDGHSLSYGELDRRSNLLARYLRTCGVKPGILVGLCVNRSLEMAVALLGILKAGGAYVPLDPAYPKQRLQLILEDSQVAVLVTEKSLLELLPACSARLVLLDSDWPSIHGNSEGHPSEQVHPADLAYVIYTSHSNRKAQS